MNLFKKEQEMQEMYAAQRAADTQCSEVVRFPQSKQRISSSDSHATSAEVQEECSIAESYPAAVIPLPQKPEQFIRH